MNSILPAGKESNRNLGSVRLDYLAAEIAVGIVLFAFLKPDSLEYIGLSWLDTFLMLLNVVILAALFIAVLAGKIRITNVSVAMFAVWMCLAVPTLLVSHEYMQLIKIAGPAMAICLFTDYMMQNHALRFLKGVVWTLLVLYGINLVTIIQYYPEGMYDTLTTVGDNYFMGFDNGMIANLIPLSCYAMVLSYIERGTCFTLLSVIALAISIVSVVYVQAATSIIQISIFVIMAWLASSGRCKALFNPNLLFAIFVIATVLLVFFRVQYYFADLIYDVFGKDASLTGRTALWDFAIARISQSPWLGSGATGAIVQGVNGHSYPHPHCLILDLLFKGGIPMLLSFVAMLVSFSKNYFKADNDVLKGILIAALFSLLVGEITGSAQFKVFFWQIFAMSSYLGTLNQLSSEARQTSVQNSASRTNGLMRR